MTNAAAVLECPEVTVDSSRECRTTFLPRPSGAEDGGGCKEEGACLGLNTCQSCGWSKPRGGEPTCAHAARGPMTLLSPPHRRTKPVVPDIEGHDSAASVMPWSTRRWPTRQVAPEESGNIRRGRERALAEAIRASGNPRINDWGRHNDPVLVCGCGYLHTAGARVVAEDQADAPRLMWAWARASAPELRWDDTERKGRVKRLLGDRISNVRSIDAPIDEAKILHRRWRRHVAESDTFLARWARQTAGRLDRVLVIGSEYVVNTRRHRDIRLRKRRDQKASKKWPRFDPTTLTPDGYKRWEAERFLDRALAHHNYADECPRADNSKVGRHGSDGGWARNVGTRTADTILARKNALERVVDDVDARLAGHHDVATAAKAELEKLIDTINEAAQRLPDQDIFDWVYWLLNARDRNGGLGATEKVLAWLSDQQGVKTDVVRRVLAYQLATAFREPLRPWAGGRTGRGAWVPPVLPAARSVSADAFEKLFAPKQGGRRPDRDPRLVALALYLAEGIYHQLEQGIAGDEGFGLAAIEGYWRDRWPAEGIVLALSAAATAEIADRHATFEGRPETMPRYPSRAEIDEIVARVDFGRNGACRALAFEIAALAYNLPRKALEATVKRTK
jgi:hypothetical protein